MVVATAIGIEVTANAKATHAKLSKMLWPIIGTGCLRISDDQRDKGKKYADVVRHIEHYQRCLCKPYGGLRHTSAKHEARLRSCVGAMAGEGGVF